MPNRLLGVRCHALTMGSINQMPVSILVELSGRAFDDTQRYAMSTIAEKKTSVFNALPQSTRFTNSKINGGGQ